MQNRGLDVTCYERVEKYKVRRRPVPGVLVCPLARLILLCFLQPFGGPIQMAGNALGALEAIDGTVAGAAALE